MSNSDETLLTIDEVAKELRVSGKSVRNWIRSGELIAFDFGGYKITRKDLEEFKEKRRVTNRAIKDDD